MSPQTAAAGPVAVKGPEAVPDPPGPIHQSGDLPRSCRGQRGLRVAQHLGRHHRIGLPSLRISGITTAAMSRKDASKTVDRARPSVRYTLRSCALIMCTQRTSARDRRLLVQR